MKFKFRHKSTENEETYQKISLYGVILDFWLKLVTETRYRISGSVSVSLAIHLLLILGYFSLSALDQSFETPIQEISFIDLSELEKPEEVIKKKNSQPPPKSRTVETQPEEEQDITTTGASAPITLGGDRIFLDSRRKQAPIKVNQLESLNNDITDDKDILNVSPALGVKRDDRVSKPQALDLGKDRDLLMASTSKSSRPIAFNNAYNPQIDLSGGKVDTGPAESMASDFSTPPPQEKKDEPKLKPKETQTIITGVLANREILKKVIPPFPRWAKIQGISATISLHFTVMENGLVKENVIVNRTSGSLQWDKTVIAALKNWQFVSLPKKGVREDQSGVITFQFIL
jgi:TonB family protein